MAKYKVSFEMEAEEPTEGDAIEWVKGELDTINFEYDEVEITKIVVEKIPEEIEIAN